MALKRAVRLRNNADFQRVRKQGRSTTSRLLAVAWMSNDTAQTRIGFVVGKRISKHAVRRNYIKRILGEAIRPLLPELSGHWDVVISARSQALSANLQELSQDIESILRRVRLLSSPPPVKGLTDERSN